MKGRLDSETSEPNRFRTLVPAGIVLALTGADKFEDHWWYDNSAHLLGGLSVGTVIHHYTDDEHTALLGFLALTSVWEVFEYLYGERPWDGSMCFDHAMEDTVLDTVMGLVGAYLACKCNMGDD